MRWTGFRVALTALLAAVFLVGPTATSASADAYGCHARTCVNVLGHGNYVGKVTIYRDLYIRESDSGYYLFKLNGRVVHKSLFHSYHNESYWHSHRWSSYYNFNQYLRKGDRVCGQFQSYHYTSDTACETVGG